MANATIILFSKRNKNPLFPQNCRAIILPASLSKLAEKIVHNWLKKENNNKNIIPPEQYKFRANHTTELQTLLLTATIISYINNKQTCSLLIMDISKAFDKVWHQGLNKK